MRLFQGTNVDFDKIDISKSNPWKDFGKGFYLTDICEQALKMGRKKALIFGGSPIVQNMSLTKSTCTMACSMFYRLPNQTRSGRNSFS